MTKTDNKNPKTELIISGIVGIAYLSIALVANYLAGIYTIREASNSVSDILLDNIPVFNVSYIFIDGAVILSLFVIIVLIWHPKQIPFVLKSTALFILIRSLSVILTHTAPAADRIIIDTNDFLQKIFFDNELFFSGHTGLPFLLALIYRDNKRLFVIFMTATIVFAVSVILGHLHYSIDVFGAFFITYTIYVLAKLFFATDYRMFSETNKKLVNSK